MASGSSHPTAVSSEALRALRESALDLREALVTIRDRVPMDGYFLRLSRAAMEKHSEALALAAQQSPSAPSREPGCGCTYEVGSGGCTGDGSCFDSTRTDGRPHPDYGLPRAPEQPSESPAEDVCPWCITPTEMNEEWTFCPFCGRRLPFTGLTASPVAPTGAGVPAGEKLGVVLIAEERRRQVEREGWSAAHDAGHTRDEMAIAAACYAIPDDMRGGMPVDWPWADEWWKPSPFDRVRELVKAGALIAAEIDRLQRRAARTVPAAPAATEVDDV